MGALHKTDDPHMYKGAYSTMTQTTSIAMTFERPYKEMSFILHKIRENNVN